MKIFLLSKKHKFLNLAMFSKNIEKFWDTIWIVLGLYFFHGFYLDSILGHRKMKSGQLEHLDRLFEGLIQWSQVVSLHIFNTESKKKCQKLPLSPKIGYVIYEWSLIYPQHNNLVESKLGVFLRLGQWVVNMFFDFLNCEMNQNLP